jgi:hypothetical protein
MKKKKGWPKTQDGLVKFLREAMIAEVAERSGLSERTVKWCIKWSVKHGWLEEDPKGTWRASIPTRVRHE